MERLHTYSLSRLLAAHAGEEDTKSAVSAAAAAAAATATVDKRVKAWIGPPKAASKWISPLDRSNGEQDGQQRR